MAADITKYNPSSLGRPLGHYQHVTRVKASEFLFLAGQLAVDRDGNVVGRDDFERQTRQVFENLRLCLESADAGFGDVVKFTTYLTDARYVPEFMRVRAELFGSIFPVGDYPPNTLLIVDRLVKEGLLIEIEAIAAVGTARAAV